MLLKKIRKYLIIREAEAGRFQVQFQPKLYSETLFQGLQDTEFPPFFFFNGPGSVLYGKLLVLF